MRRCAAILLLCLALAAPAWAGTAAAPAPVLPTFKQARDWQVSYVTRWYGDDGRPAPALDEPLLMASFRAPNLVQIKQGGDDGFTAVANGRWIRLLFPARKFAVWAEEQDVCDFFAGCNLVLAGLTSPVGYDWEEVIAALRVGGRGEGARFELLPEEVVAGRPCVVLHSVDTVSEEGDWTTTQWFDREYGVTLALRWREPGRTVEMRAKSAKFNVGFDARRFALTLPKGVREFRGSVTEWEDVEVISDYVAGTAKPQKIEPFLPVKIALLEPTALPKGFTGPYHVATGTGEAASPRWDVWQMWLSPEGGVISLAQSDAEYDDVPKGETKAAPLRGLTAQVARYHEPFDGVIITWKEGGRHHWLEGTGVTAAELKKMAEGMKQVTLEAAEGDGIRPPSERELRGVRSARAD